MTRRENQGMALGLLAVLIFSLTLPMTGVAVQGMHPLLAALGRALLAAIPAAAMLYWRRQPLPTLAQLKGLCLVVLGVILGFPLLTSLAMQTLPASHGALVNGLQPLMVAIFAAWRAHERPSRAFWACAAAGSVLVLAYAVIKGAGSLSGGDGLMLLAIVLGGLGYAEGGRLARQMGGWQVICWALVLASPLLLLPVLGLAWRHGLAISPAAWGAFAYITVFSQFIGFFAWYAGLAQGGIARVGQVQLLQIFFTMAFSGLLFGEHIDSLTWLFAGAVVCTVVLGRKTAVQAAPPLGGKAA